ncbi:MAG: S41 family peptidase [candidate division WOR-3 bacterium]
MNKRFLLISIFVLSILISFSIGLVWGDQENTYSLLRIFNRVLSNIQSSYVDSVDNQTLIRGAIKGMIDTLRDPHTNYLNKNEYTSLKISTEGEFGGIGAQLGMRNNRPVVITPIDNTPAKKAGLLPGDVILKVDGETTEGKNLDEVVRRIRGKPGTKVTLLIERPILSEPIEFTITRSTIKIDAIPYAGVIKDDIGYIRLADFSRTASSELRDNLDSLFGLGVKKIIFDLRHNSGGLLNEGVEVTECFLGKEKDIVSTRGRASELRVFKSTADIKYGDFPLVVLIDSSSASASEIVAGAIQDWDRGLLIGTNTFGKGSVQNIFPMEDGGALKLTVARWFTPSGRCIDKPLDTLKARELSRIPFTTLGPLHRKVYGAGGIMPDTVIPRKVYSWIEMEILRKGLYFDFAVKYTNRQKDISKDFMPGPALIDEFKKYLREKEIKFTDAQFDSSRTEISHSLAQEIVAIVWGTKAAIALALKRDHYVTTAVAILESAKTTKDLFWFNKKK